MTFVNHAFSYLIISFVKILDGKCEIVKAINEDCCQKLKLRLQQIKSLFKNLSPLLLVKKNKHRATHYAKGAKNTLPNQGQVNKESMVMTCIRHRFLPPSEPGARLSMQRITANNMSVARSVRGDLGLAHLSRRDIRRLTLAPFTRDIR